MGRLDCSAFLLGLALALLEAGIASAAPGDLLFKIPNPAARSDDRFGVCAAAFGPDILVGADQADEAAADTGAVYLFSGANGALVHKFTEPVPVPGSHLGYAVVAVGDIVAAGAPFEGPNGFIGGSVYLFDGKTGAFLRKIENPEPYPYAYFGFSVAAVEGRLIVGSPGYRPGGGRVYVFDPATGREMLRIQGPSGCEPGKFGNPVICIGARIFAASRNKDEATGLDDGGCVNVYDGENGKLLGTIRNPRGAAGDDFGIYLSARGQDLLAGSMYDSGLGKNAGAAYLMRGGDPGQCIRFDNPDPQLNDHACSIAASHNDIVVGSLGKTVSGLAEAGAVFLFDATTGALKRRVDNPEPNARAKFGRWLAPVGGKIVVCAQGNDTGAQNAGCVFVLEGGAELQSGVQEWPLF